MLSKSFVFFIVIIAFISVSWVLDLRPKTKWLHKKNKRKAKQLLKELKRYTHDPSHIFYLLRKANCFVFEELLLLSLQKKGFRIQRNTAYTGDGGIDGTFYDQQGNKYLIQAKRYRSAINPQHVEEFAILVDTTGVAGGFFVHTGRTGKKSYRGLTSKTKMISGQKLLAFIGIDVI